MPDAIDPEKIRRREQATHDLRETDEASRAVRIERLLSVSRPIATPYSHFSTASGECLYLYRDGHFYGCVSLCQSVGEALVRLICEIHKTKPEGDFEKTLLTLRKRKLIDESFHDAGLRLWSGRHDFHHMNPAIPDDRGVLSGLAKEKIDALAELETWLFSFDTPDGKIAPLKRKFWPESSDGTYQVFLRIE